VERNNNLDIYPTLYDKQSTSVILTLVEEAVADKLSFTRQKYRSVSKESKAIKYKIINTELTTLRAG
jgi:hypothetical protein